ncbi:hypothetical protein [Actinophytocola sp.]|uniref:hypothetical protein n=1 Tax=Actinophytocola sp. TaxID=1872138 RepID=UPI003C70DEB1
MGERPVYPVAMSTLAHTTTGPARWHPTRVTAALLSFCAMLLVFVGSFLPLYSSTLSVGSDELEVTISPWSADVSGPTEPGEVPALGYPLVFAAIILACAAALCWYAAIPAATQGVGRVAATTTVIGGGFLIGTVWTAALVVMAGIENVILLGTMAPGFETEATYLVGYWLLLVAAVLGLGAAVLALIPVRQATWAQANPDVSTPPYGMAMAVQPHVPPTAQQAYRAQDLFQIDPLTGRPLAPSPPSGVPVAYQQHHQPTQPPATHLPVPPSTQPDQDPVPESPPGPDPDEHKP